MSSQAALEIGDFQIGAMNRGSLADAFARDGIVRIGGFLAGDSAAAMHQHLRRREDWLQVFNSGDKLYELSRGNRAALAREKQAELDQAIYAGARDGFQYRYETIRVPDSKSERSPASDPVHRFAQWLSAGPARDFLREVTGSGDIRYADCQATAYSPGDFLTGHDDEFEGKNRRAAYVFGLTPLWRLEWGGLLVMHSNDDAPARAFVPGMNILTIFRVGQMHSVSEVTRAAAYRRYSITGWLRGEAQPR